MSIIFPIIAIVILLLFAFYFVIHFRNLFFIAYFQSPKWLPWVLAVLMTGICIFIAQSIFSFFTIVMLFLFYSFIITDILNIILRKCLKQESTKRIWRRIYQSSIINLAFTVIITSMSYFAAIHVVTTKYNLETNKSFGMNNIKISFISDLHLGTTMDTEKLKEYCKQIQNSNSDILVLDGDIFDENTSKQSMEIASRLLGQIKTSYGIYYVFGNHDVVNHGRDRNFSEQDVVSNLTLNNIIILNDKARLVKNKFYIIGRKDASFFQNAKRKSLIELLHGIDKSKFMILLDHQPLDINRASKLGIDLQLSGHTHGGQIWPAKIFSSIFHIDGLVYGYKKSDNYQLIVSSGIGAWGYPARLGSKSEIVQIVLHSNAVK